MSGTAAAAGTSGQSRSMSQEQAAGESIPPQKTVHLGSQALGLLPGFTRVTVSTCAYGVVAQFASFPALR
jgi:hypothetical protein